MRDGEIGKQREKGKRRKININIDRESKEIERD